MFKLWNQDLNFIAKLNVINLTTEWLGKAWFGLEQLQIQLFDQ